MKFRACDAASTTPAVAFLAAFVRGDASKLDLDLLLFGLSVFVDDLRADVTWSFGSSRSRRSLPFHGRRLN